MENKQITKAGRVSLNLIKAPPITKSDPEIDELPDSGNSATQLRFSPKFMADSLGKYKK